MPNPSPEDAYAEAREVRRRRKGGAAQPNIQNVPIRTEEGRKIKDTIVRIFPDPDLSGLEKIVEEQKTYYGTPRKMDLQKMIFVFGSNEAGIHGAGAAKFALEERGAVFHQGLGRQGQSYAIPTKDIRIHSLGLKQIREYVDAFLIYAKVHPKLNFQVTAIGCGLAGFHHSEIAPMFIGAPDNCYFDEAWKPWLDNVEFWGTF